MGPLRLVRPTAADWKLTFQRLDYMRPGFVRVVEPAYDYFAGYDALRHNPKYRWNSVHVRQLLQILGYTSRGITVILGDWSNPMIDGDARIPEPSSSRSSTIGTAIPTSSTST